MVTLQKSEKQKENFNRVKITLKTSENLSKVSGNPSKQSDFCFFRKLTEGQLFVLTYPSVSPQSEIHSFRMIFTLSGVIFTWLE